MNPKEADIEAQKKRLRTEMKAQRGAIEAKEAKAAAQDVIEQIKPLSARKKRWQVALYHPVHSELDSLPLARFFARNRSRLSLPVVMKREDPMIFRPWKMDEALVENVHHIKVPVNRGLQVQPDLLIVPLLAFDEQGHRLGYGGGYYDRTLAALRAQRNVLAVGLAFDGQKVDKVPVDPHDQSLDYILTPSSLRQF